MQVFLCLVAKTSELQDSVLVKGQDLDGQTYLSWPVARESGTQNDSSICRVVDLLGLVEYVQCLRGTALGLMLKPLSAGVYGLARLALMRLSALMCGLPRIYGSGSRWRSWSTRVGEMGASSIVVGQCVVIESTRQHFETLDCFRIIVLEGTVVHCGYTGKSQYWGMHQPFHRNHREEGNLPCHATCIVGRSSPVVG